jgi:hypothetical protein
VDHAACKAAQLFDKQDCPVIPAAAAHSLARVFAGAQCLNESTTLEVGHRGRKQRSRARR